jgi:hypothetical protein
MLHGTIYDICRQVIRVFAILGANNFFLDLETSVGLYVVCPLLSPPSCLGSIRLLRQCELYELSITTWRLDFKMWIQEV